MSILGSTSSPLNLAGELIASNFQGWTPELREEFERNAFNLKVGSQLLSEDARVKVWMITVPPGGRLQAHRHILDYFWTALADGHSIQHSDDGTTRKVSYRAGQTHHLEFGPGQYLLHDLVNDGPTELRFLTVEHKRS